MTNPTGTPMLRQYQELKQQHPGTLLFFRLGDFYELFFEDAVTGARELQITLTARNKERGDPVPMCGVPHHAAANYIAKLVRKGYRVAICEQAEPAGKGTKLVRREVARVVTPGTAIDEQLVETKDPVYLAAVCSRDEVLGAAFLELSTGEFSATQISGDDVWLKFSELLDGYAPRELLFPVELGREIEKHFGVPQAPTLLSANGKPDANTSVPNYSFSELENGDFDASEGEDLLNAQFQTKELTGFGIGGRTAA